MDTDVMVTIGIPVYNAGRFLSSTIDSVLAQTHRNFEIIITIDGATDDSLKIAANFDDLRIILIDEKENKGISFRLNQQISIARGKYFARMDADDLMFPDRIEKQLEFMLKNPEIEVTGSDAVVIDDKNLILGYREGCKSISKSTILKNILFNHPTVFGKTSWFRNNTYNSEFDGVEDFLLWNISFSHSRFLNLNEPLHFYRDPPLVNPKTYIYRQKQFRKAVRYLRRKSVIGNLKTTQLAILSMVKESIFYLFYIAGLSDTIIRRRNIKMSEESQNYYLSILENIPISKTGIKHG
jgi:glycosyltransferase involved in cell wall biosynthesis